MTILSNIILLLYILDINNIYAHVENTNSNQMQIPVPIGVVVDMNSSFGAMVELCIDMAISDFYASHTNHKTRLQLIKKDAKKLLNLNMAGIDCKQKHAFSKIS